MCWVWCYLTDPGHSRAIRVSAAAPMSVDLLGSVQMDRLTMHWQVGASAPILVTLSELVQLHRGERTW